MTINQNIVTIVQDVLSGNEIKDEQYETLINAFYQDPEDISFYGMQLLTAWDNLKDISIDEKFSNYLTFILEVSIRLRTRIASDSEISITDVSLDQVAALGGVLNDTTLNNTFNPDLSANFITVTKNLPILDQEYMFFVANTILPHTSGFQEDRTNQLNKDFVTLVLELNTSSKIISNLSNKRGLLWEFMNARHVHRATYSLLRIEAAKPGTFTEENIHTLQKAVQLSAPFTEETLRISSEWNMMLIEYIKNGQNLEKLQQLYEAYPEKQKGFNNDLSKLQISLYENNNLSM